MTTEKQSTPITAEGLRGLGMSHYTGCTFEWYRLKIAGRMVNVYRFEPGTPFNVSVGGFPERNPEAMLGHAPDLETVAGLIDVLRRMNGGVA